MLELRMAVFSKAASIYWYAYLGSLPFHEAVPDCLDMPCDLSQLRRSCEQPGLYCLFVCLCGDRSCHSTWVDVIHEGLYVRWAQVFSNTETGSCGPKIGDVDWTFEWIKYRETLMIAERITLVAAPLIIQEAEDAPSDGDKHPI
jgi:hypothetical protein